MLEIKKKSGQKSSSHAFSESRHLKISPGSKFLRAKESKVHFGVQETDFFPFDFVPSAANKGCVVMFVGHFGKPGVGKLFFFFFAEEKSAFHIC